MKKLLLTFLVSLIGGFVAIFVHNSYYDHSNWRISNSRKNLDNKDVFYIALEKALHNFLKSKFSIETFDYSKEKIYNLLLRKEIEKESLELFIKLIENCEFARFTPASNVAINNDYENAVQVITEIDKVI